MTTILGIRVFRVKPVSLSLSLCPRNTNHFDLETNGIYTIQSNTRESDCKWAGCNW
jgi:hypothetical protein